jgi:hypothetical protein
MGDQDSSMTQVQDILDKIANIQQQEDKLIAEIKAGGGNPSNLVNVLNTLSNTRIQLYQILAKDFKNIVNTNSSSGQALTDQITIQGVVEANLNASKVQLETLLYDKNHKLRLIEINSYYNKHYIARVELVKTVVKVLVVVLIYSIVKQFSIIPDNIMSVIFILIALVGSILIIRSVYYLTGRDNMAYDEYNFMGESRPDNESLWEYNKKHFFDPLKSEMKALPGNITGAACMGKKCCGQGTVWNNNLSRCDLYTGTDDAGGAGGAGGTDDAAADAAAADADANADAGS